MLLTYSNPHKKSPFDKYTSRGKTISRSKSHDDLWVIDLPTGGFYTIIASETTMLKMNPPDKKWLLLKGISLN